MSIRFFCPSGHRLRAPDRKGGQEIRCPVCRQRAIVPETNGGARFDDDSHPVSLTADQGEGANVAERARAGSGPPPLPGTEDIGEKTDSIRRTGHERADPEPERRSRLRGRPRMMPADAYRPDPGKVRLIRWLAVFLGFVVVFSTFPAWGHLDLQGAPGWARLVLLLAALQGCYIVWMLATPDWASVWVMMLVFAFAASVYGMMTAIVLATPLDRPVPLEIGELRLLAPRWCGSVLGLMVLATYLSGLTSARWRRSVEREIARTVSTDDGSTQPA